MMLHDNLELQISPMELMEELAKNYNEKICYVVDKDYRICVWINNIDRIKSRKYLSNLEGRDLNYRDACTQYIRNLMDTKYQVRYKKKLYATTPMRNIVKRNLVERLE